MIKFHTTLHLASESIDGLTHFSTYLYFYVNGNAALFVCYYSDTHTLRNMAASLKTLSGLAQNKSFLSFGVRYLKTRGNVYTPSNHIIPKDNPEDKIVMAENGDTIVCWHPQQK